MGAVDGPVVGGDEERVVGLGVVTVGEVLPEGPARALAEADETLFASSAVAMGFAVDVSGAGFEVEVSDVEVAEFSGADAGVE